MKRKEMEKVIRVEDYERKMRLARADKKYIKTLYYKFILFFITLFDDINKIKNSIDYKGEWEKQNIELDRKKKRITELEKAHDDLYEVIDKKEAEKRELQEALDAQKKIVKNLRKRIREIKKK